MLEEELQKSESPMLSVELDAQVQEVELSQLIAYPVQARKLFSSESIQELANEIKAAGGITDPLIIVPVNWIEYCEGHDETCYVLAGERRYRAAQLLGLATVPCRVALGNYGDPQGHPALRALALMNNLSRVDLTPSEQAAAFEQLQMDFDWSPEQIASELGLPVEQVKAQLRLLGLPPEVRALVDELQPPSYLVDYLLKLSESNLNDAAQLKVAELLFKSDVIGDEVPVAERLNDLLGKAGVAALWPVHRGGWELAWPKKPIIPATPVEGVPLIPACAKCPSLLISARHAQWCLFDKCFEAKWDAWRQAQVKQASQKLNVPPLPDDAKKAYPVTIDYRNVAGLQAMLGAGTAPDNLYLAPASEQQDYHVENVTGSRVVALVTTDPKLVDQLRDVKPKEVKKSEPVKPKSDKAKPPTPEEIKRIKREQAAQEKARAEARALRATWNRAAADIVWLAQHTAQQLAGQLKFNGIEHLTWLLAYTRQHELGRWNFSMHWPPVAAQLADYDKRIKGLGEQKSGPGPDDAQKLTMLLREAVLYVLITSRIAQNGEHFERKWPEAQTMVERMFFKRLKPTEQERSGGLYYLSCDLLEHWNVPPIHHTDHNCWRCGAFSSSDHITKLEESQGWRVVRASKGEVTDVTCGKCTPPLELALKTKPSASAKPKPKAKSKTNLNQAP